MATPKLRYVAPAGSIQDESLAPEPVEIYGLPESGGSDVQSVNGKTGAVILGASDVGALPTSYTPPAPGWASVTGKPSTFPPAPHDHTIANVTGLQSALDGKAPTSHTHTVAQVTGLQAIIDDLTSRIEALESAAG